MTALARIAPTVVLTRVGVGLACERDDASAFLRFEDGRALDLGAYHAPFDAWLVRR